MSKLSVVGLKEQAFQAPDAVVVALVNSQGDCDGRIEKLVGKKSLTQLMNAHEFKGEQCKTVETMVETRAGFFRLILLGVGEVEKNGQDDWIKLGGTAFSLIGRGATASVMLLLKDYVLQEKEIADFALGLHLRHYDFKKYKTSKTTVKEGKKTTSITLVASNAVDVKKAVQKGFEVAQGVITARDLVNEPANVLGPFEFAKRIEKLEKNGVKIEILDEKELKKIGMAALLGVSRGSRRPPRVVVMRWNGKKGTKGKDRPLVFIGKGVVFDTGGISLKPGAGMEDMKGDMAGAAAVTGLIQVLSARKANVDAIGIVGLVENMPDGDAQRPGDIVTSMSGQTIEVINTDAEGRLVLADLLWYAKERFKPKFMVNLATLTGAIMVALGQHHAGLFSNDDMLASHLLDAGLHSGEKLWRMPLGPEYDKMVDSTFADMRNSCGRYAGSITAAQFLKRFVGDVAWAHLDIAGTAMSSLKNEYNQSWGSGYGVRLLDRLVADYYEG